MKKRLLGFVVFFLAIQNSFAGIPDLSLAQSVPLETTSLAVPNLRTTSEQWLDMIQNAKTSLDIEQFYITSTGENKGNDLAMVKVLDAVAAAAKRGVKVRILVDAKFYATYPKDLATLTASAPSITVKKLDLSKTTNGVLHAKFFVADKSQSFLGSANFDWRALTHIHEIGLRTSNQGVSSGLLAIFETDWANGILISGTDTAPESVTLETSNERIQFLASPASMNPKGIRETLPMLLSKIKTAKTIQIQAYEYSTSLYNVNAEKTWTVLQDALKEAASRGAKIQLMVDQSKVSSNRRTLSELAALPSVEVRGVLIPKFSGGEIAYARLVHSKYMIFDTDTAWMGTENLTGDYFNASRNVGALFSIPDRVKELSQVFSQVWNSSYAMSVK